MSEKYVDQGLTKTKRKPISDLVGKSIKNKGKQGRNPLVTVTLTNVDHQQRERIIEAYRTGKFESFLTDDDNRAIEMHSLIFALLKEHKYDRILAINALMELKKITRVTAFKYIRDMEYIYGCTYGFDKAFEKSIFMMELKNRMSTATGSDYANLAKVYMELMNFNEDDDLPDFRKMANEYNPRIIFNPSDINGNWSLEEITEKKTRILRKLNIEQ